MKVLAAILRVASENPRVKVRELVAPANRLKGIDRKTVSDYAETEVDQPKQKRQDIRPQDVFFPKPAQASVLKPAQTGKDMSRAIEHQIPKDKGFDGVNHLSQYLVETKGGGSGTPVK